jgi:hypothetical protein
VPLIFINYRSSDEGWVAAMLDTELTRRFGAQSVFRDIRSIQPGQEYASILLDKIRASTALLVVIGEHWFGNATSKPLADERDWVRREIREAFAAGVRVLPVLVDETAELVDSALPYDIRQLAGLQALRLRHREAHTDVPRVVNELLALEPSLAGNQAEPHDDVAIPLPRSPGLRQTRRDLDRLLRETLPQSQQHFGNRARLVDLAMSVLHEHERLIFLARCQFSGPGAAVALITDRRLCLVEITGSSRVRQIFRLDLRQVQRVEIHRHRRLLLPPSADVDIRTRDENLIILGGMPLPQAEQVAELLSDTRRQYA